MRLIVSIMTAGSNSGLTSACCFLCSIPTTIGHSYILYYGKVCFIAVVKLLYVLYL